MLVRAIDVGHGNTKHTTSDSEDGFGCHLFPSIAPQPGQDMDFGKAFRSANFIQLEVEGATYVVGPDSPRAAASSTQRLLDPEYSKSNVHLALIRGALYYMRQPKIDLLVLGLPLTTFKTHKDALRKRMTGGHTIPNPVRRLNPGAPEFLSVEIGSVRVLPQPVGAFFNYSVPRGVYEAMNEQTNLIIDVGHGTIDWFFAEGSSPIPPRCGGYQGGVSVVVSRIAQAIGNGKDNFKALSRIDRALRTKEKILINGKEIDVCKDYSKIAENAIRESINVMLQSVGNTVDVDNIIMTGGGANIFYDEIQKSFPYREIIKDDDAIVSNVCGFQLVGEQWAKEMA